MRRRHPAHGGDEAAAIRFAWWAAFLATLSLVAVLGLAKSAQAMTLPGTDATATLVTPAPPAGEESEDEAEASEDEGFEDEECEEDEEECEEDFGPGEAPRECLLTSAQTTATATANKDKVRLQIRYTTSTPTTVTVEYGLHGGKGSLFLGSEKKHFGRRGVLRLTKVLTENQMTKAMAAKGFTVQLRVPAAPNYCKSFFDYQLDVRQATPSGLSWRPSE
ncbi:MAG TPA: hypothetical protein VGO13_02680 [Solirubrobacterales bacterium]|jgi:hypothetical protein|nr:hypothetical protein [Solirubrobacterales bacterium]